MKITVSVLIIVVSISFYYCSTKTTKSDSIKDEKNNISAGQSLQKDRNNISPGTADIQAEILSYSDSSRGLSAILKIEKVNNYGSATPPLAIGTEILCGITETLVKEKNQSIEELFKKGNSYNFIIKYQFGIHKKDNIPNWTIISFN